MRSTKGFAVVGAIVGIVVVALIAVAAYFIIDGNNKATNFNDYDFYSVIEATKDNGEIGDHVKGSADAPVLIFEYADYQCPGCATINPRVNKAVEKLNGKLGLVYRSFLLSYHKNGTAAASAAEAAGLQGYWKPYADMLFERQSEWEDLSSSARTDMFAEYFKKVSDGKGDVEKFKEDMDSDAVSKKISFDMGVGKRVGVEGTPAFFIDGQLIDWSEAGSVEVNGKTVSWDEGKSGDGFVELLEEIVEAKLGEQKEEAK
ncbi:thioredoxin domain-containing protein [Candidatus Saccharibacteria bacterium]|nr:thioredoxin domain-containing protein [Candidatus Saccharibacteria bacterium]